MYTKFKQAKQTEQMPKWSGDKLVVGANVYKKPQDEEIYRSSAVPVAIPEDAIKHGSRQEN